MSCDLDLRKCFEYVKDLTLKAGQAFNSGFESENLVEAKTEHWDVVTEYDRKIENMLIKGIKERYPSHEIIAEETTAALKQTPVLTDAPTWFIDPIDGTTNFIHGFPHCAISIGLTVCKDLVIGIVYNPVSSEFYSAIKGEGAYLNDKPIRTSQTTELKKSLIEIQPFSIFYSSKNKDLNVGRFEALVTASQGCRFIGSSAIGLAYLARGMIDCFQMDMLQPWDVAGGILLVREAGGTVINTKECGEYDLMKTNTIAAANDTLATELKTLIADTDLRLLRKRFNRT